MNPDPKTRDPKKPKNADDSFSDLDKLDRPELDDEEADWEKETGVRRVNSKPPPPMKLAGSA